MKGFDLLKSSSLVKSAGFVFVALAFFYFGKHWSDDNYQQVIFFNSNSNENATTPSISISPNHNKTFDIVSLINNTKEAEIRDDHTLAPIPQSSLPSQSPPPPSPPPPPPPQPAVQRLGLVDENGVMRNDFEVGEFDPSVMEDWNNETEVVEGDSKGVRVNVGVRKFGMCRTSMRDYIPCMDNVEAVKGLTSTEKGEKFERHCPDKDKGLTCLVPAPKGYKAPIPWPRSRDEVWYSNVPHAQLAEYKGGQNWITVYKDKFRFPGGGTQFIHGADQYLDQISQMIPGIAFGRHTRVVLDVGCGVASFGAYLTSRNVLTLSVAPKDVHENQIQFALERGIPAMVAAFATKRLLYPSQAFDLIHCSRCRVNWTRDDGILLLEVNRLLRAGGYFVWAAQPVYKHEALLEEQWDVMINLTNRLCWNLVKKEGYIAIWQKPLDNSCYLSHDPGTQPQLCDKEDDPDNVWYVDLKPCITPLPEDGSGANITTWPARLHNPPERLQSIKLDAFVSRKDLFKAESKYWKEIIDSYVRSLHWKKFKLRNVMDMRASFGGFAAALIDNQLDCWVMNVVPVSGPNTLPVIYDRGLLGVMHDWCEPFDTYPRTYDFLHAAGLFSVEQKRCNISSIMLEMNRILRPGGRVYIRDSIMVIDELQEIGKAMGWHVTQRDTAEGPHASYRILTCDKRLR
ncbi:probable methyltransferase PMT11 [Cynara cardunculus var. scolymus]|uniref:probable methyltransferase PMT11 n=1 Tax=Cynara cardunculus var. scolymus TaxID=59895 RepID=UPI000D6259CB|nr:probable methyltransferase PMT11 [Cynara cardunculus var. scolymus]